MAIEFLIDGKKEFLGPSETYDTTPNECYRDAAKEKVEEIVNRTKNGGAEIVKYLGNGSAFYAPAASGVEMAESYLKNLKKQLPCAAYLNGEYGIKDLYAGVPVIIGEQGAEKIVELELSPEEKSDFNNSIEAVKVLCDAAKKIDKSL